MALHGRKKHWICVLYIWILEASVSPIRAKEPSDADHGAWLALEHDLTTAKHEDRMAHPKTDHSPFIGKEHKDILESMAIKTINYTTGRHSSWISLPNCFLIS